MPHLHAHPLRIRFGLFELDSTSGELHRQGLKIKLQPKPCRVLELLLERPGEVVTRDDLRARLWAADTFVDFEHGLNTAVRKLRRALGDSAENPRFVETLARRGYRFVAPVEANVPPVTPGTAPAAAPEAGEPRAPAELLSPARWPARARWGLGALIIGLSLMAFDSMRPVAAGPTPVRPLSLAVLPFRVLGEPGADSDLGLGLADRVIGRLSDTPGLRVRPTSSILAHEGRRSSAHEAGRRLDVETVLTGTVRRAEHGFRVAVQLLPMHERHDAKRTTFDLEESDLAHVAERIAERVAQVLGVPAPPTPEKHAGYDSRTPPPATLAEALWRADKTLK